MPQVPAQKFFASVKPRKRNPTTNMKYRKYFLLTFASALNNFGTEEIKINRINKSVK